MSTILQSVKKKIYAVCPDLEIQGLPNCFYSIGLPEVLRAIEDVRGTGEFMVGYGIFKMMWSETEQLNWNLLVNLDGQSEEVWKFLDGIL